MVMTDVTSRYQYLINLVGLPEGGVTIWSGDFGTPNTMKLDDLVTLERTERKLRVVISPGAEEVRRRMRSVGTKWHIFIDEPYVVELGRDYGISPEGTVDIMLIHELSHTHATAEAPGLEFDEFAPGLVRAQMRGLLNYLAYKPEAASDLLGYIAERFDAEVEGWPIPPRFKGFLKRLRAQLQPGPK